MHCARTNWTWSAFDNIVGQFFRAISCLWRRNDRADPRKLYWCSGLDMPSNDVILLGYRPRSDIQASANIRRAVSEDCLLESRGDGGRPGFSMLKLSKTRISVGDSVTVYWDIREQCGANDWIGLFDLGKLYFHLLHGIHITLHHCIHPVLSIKNTVFMSKRFFSFRCTLAFASSNVLQYKEIRVAFGQALNYKIYRYISKVNFFSTQLNTGAIDRSIPHK